MKYAYVPISQRKPLRWPNGKRLAVMITTNLEYWDATKDTPKPFYPGGPGIVGGDLPGNVYDNPNYTWREYGQRVGVWRMFDTFRPVRRALDLHDERQDGVGAARRDRCRAQARLGNRRAQLRADRTARRLLVRRDTRSAR